MELKRGCPVQIIDDGWLYSTYTAMAKKLLATRYIHGYGYDINGTDVSLRNRVGIFKRKYLKFCLVDLGQHEIVIDLKGLKKISKIKMELLK